MQVEVMWLSHTHLCAILCPGGGGGPSETLDPYLVARTCQMHKIMSLSGLRGRSGG